MSEEHKEIMLEIKNELIAKRASQGAKVETDDEAAWKTEAVTRWGEMVELASPESWQVTRTLPEAISSSASSDNKPIQLDLTQRLTHQLLSSSDLR